MGKFPYDARGTDACSKAATTVPEPTPSPASPTEVPPPSQTYHATLIIVDLATGIRILLARQHEAACCNRVEGGATEEVGELGRLLRQDGVTLGACPQAPVMPIDRSVAEASGQQLVVNVLWGGLNSGGAGGKTSTTTNTGQVNVSVRKPTVVSTPTRSRPRRRQLTATTAAISAAAHRMTRKLGRHCTTRRDHQQRGSFRPHCHGGQPAVT